MSAGTRKYLFTPSPALCFADDIPRAIDFKTPLCVGCAREQTQSQTRRAGASRPLSLATRPLSVCSALVQMRCSHEMMQALDLGSTPPPFAAAPPPASFLTTICLRSIEICCCARLAPFDDSR